MMKILRNWPNIALVFGSETAMGLPGANSRGNWARQLVAFAYVADLSQFEFINSVAITLFEIWRQRGLAG